MAPSGSRPAALITETELLEDVRRLAAAAGCELDAEPDVEHLRSIWADAPLVLLDEAAASECLEAGFPRRDGLLLVGGQAPSLNTLHLAVRLGAERALGIPDDEHLLAEAFADVAESPAGTSGHVLAVMGACGGAGSSVFATAVATAAANRGGRTLLVDCDAIGGGLDLLLGLEHYEGLRWSRLSVSGGRVAASALHEGLPHLALGTGSLGLLSCDRDGTNAGMTSEAVRSVLQAGRRAGDTVVCDVPRTPAQAGWAALDHADMAVLVVPADIRSCVAARALAKTITDRGVPVHAVVRGPAPGGLRFRDVRRAVGLAECTEMRVQSGLPALLERGELGGLTRGALPTAAREVLGKLGHPGGVRETV